MPFGADAASGQSRSLATTVQAGFQLFSPLSQAWALHRLPRAQLCTAARGAWWGSDVRLKLLARRDASF